MNQTDRLGAPLPQRVVIVRALRGLGDLLCAVPAFRAMRQALPKARITLIGLPWARTFLERFNHYLDEFIEFPGYPGIPERSRVHQLPEFLTRMHQQPFDLAVQMHGSGIVSNPFTMLLGARINAGFFLPGQYCPDPERFLPYPSEEPEVRRHLRLMEFLGVPLQGEALEFPLGVADWRSLQAINAIHDLQPGKYACVHPGAYDPDRRWSTEQFAEVADALSASGLQVVLTGSSGEVELAQAVARSMRSPCVNLAGHTSLGALATLLKQSRLLICNDTGVSHLAAALYVPSVVVMFTDSNRWAPLNRQRHRIVNGFAPTALMLVLEQVAQLQDGQSNAA